MRDKFKAWDKINKKWIGDKQNEYLCVCDDVVVLVEYVPNNSGGYSPKSCRQFRNDELKNLEIVKSIGTSDRNKIELYVGDIIKFRTEASDLIGTVEWGEFASFYLMVKKSDNTTRMIPFSYINHGEEGMEKIGNWFENPELLPV